MYAGQNAHGWSSNYYDDESWMVLALMRAYDINGDKAYLDHAVTLYQDITAAWDSTSAHPGGIWWSRQHTQKATASNAGPVICGVRLAARTGDTAHLAFARKVYDFWFKTMVDPNTHALADHINADGTIARGRLTYNEGLMVGARSLSTARRTTRPFSTTLTRSRRCWRRTKPSRRLLVPCSPTEPTPRAPVTALSGRASAIATSRSSFAPTSATPSTAHRSSRACRLRGRSRANPTTGLYANDWAGPVMNTAAVEAQSSTAMAMNLWAEIVDPIQEPPATD